MESTQERIVAAARRLFGESGFHGTTTAEIARTAGIAEGTIYRYFKDKKELFIASARPVIEEAVRREKAAVVSGSPREVLKRQVASRIDIIRENMDVFNILFTEGPHHPEIAGILIELVSNSLTPGEWEAFARSKAGALQRAFNPLIMNVGLTAAIWAMLLVGPASEQLFSAWPVPFRYANLESDLADFVCAAMLSEQAEHGGKADA
ncbi:MAG: TetR/AcrR family transcriptional regulator [Mycobacterium leprae]